MAGMKTQMVMMVPQMVIMGWINFFFQGFVLSESRPPQFRTVLLVPPPVLLRARTLPLPSIFHLAAPSFLFLFHASLYTRIFSRSSACSFIVLTY